MSLAFILLISTKLVSACASVICSNGFQTNVCGIEKNEIAAQWYFNSSLIVFIVVTLLYFIRNRKGLSVIVFCFIALVLPMILRFFSGNGGCNFLATEVAKQLFYVSLFPLVFQLVLSLIQISKYKFNLH